MNDEAKARFSEFVAARTPVLIRLAYLLTGDQHAAEDLLQTALMKTASRWAHVRQEDPEGYVRTVLYREQVSWWHRHREVAVRQPPDVGYADPSACGVRLTRLCRTVRHRFPEHGWRWRHGLPAAARPANGGPVAEQAGGDAIRTSGNGQPFAEHAGGNARRATGNSQPFAEHAGGDARGAGRLADRGPLAEGHARALRRRPVVRPHPDGQRRTEPETLTRLPLALGPTRRVHAGPTAVGPASRCC